jgi:hypothetical protein
MDAEEEGAVPMRSFSKLAIVTLATMTVGAAVAYAQTATPPAPSNCGVETWSTDKMAYVTVPCTGGEAAGNQTAKAPGPQNCGIETYSVDKQAYVGTPCPAGTTYENPAGKAHENFNTK